MRLSHIRAEIRRSLDAFGLLRTAADISLRALNRAVMFRVMKGIAIERGDLEAAPEDLHYRFGRLDEAVLLRFARTSEYELSREFLREAFARGDECYGFLYDGELAAYTWYTDRPAPIELPGLGLKFGEGYVYIYKGFTHPKHRGHRLHSLGMAKALPIHLQRGRLGMVSYVELTNFAQRHSATRAGFSYFGTLLVARLFGRYLLWASPGCAHYQFHFERLPLDGDAASSLLLVERAPAPIAPTPDTVH